MQNVNKKGNIYLNMILKQDEPVEMVRRSIDSVKDYVDGMYITVTYSDEKPGTSPLLDLLSEYGAKVSFFKWVDDFAAARQYAMDQAPHGKDQYIYWHDADDILLYPENLPAIFKDVVAMDWSAVFMTYWYRVTLRDDGTLKDILIEHKRERIIRNDGTFKWMGKLHETLIDQRAENVQKYLRPECTVVHLTTEDRVDASLPRNIRILEQQAEEEDHKDPRTLVYLAKGYFDLGVSDKDKRREYHDKALDLFHEYLEGAGTPGTPGYREGSGWSQERANAWQFVMEIYKFAGKLPDALVSISNAIDEAPEYPIYYIDKAMVYTHLADYAKAKVYLTLATSLNQPDTTIITTPRDMKMKALEVDSRIAMEEQDLKRLIVNLAEMCKAIPDSEDLKERYRVALSLEKENKAAQSVVYLGKYLELIGQADKIPALLNATPEGLRAERFYSEMRNKHIPPRIHDKNEITIICGPGYEQWSPLSIDKGIGGSEEAIIYLSQELTKLGWKVTVYADPQYEKGEYDGVNYLPYYELNPSDVFNVMVVWRAIGFVDFKPNAKYIMCWMHDMPNNSDFTEARVNRVDSIAVLSQFHREQFKMQKLDGTFVDIPNSKFFITSNGIPDLSAYKPEVKNPASMIYSSSPDRGLVYLLLNWKKLKQEVPEATLDVYYGFEIFDAMYRGNPGRQKWKARMIKMMEQEGITFHGRVNHDELNKALSQTAIWAYPTDFTEISCITAMKAQALGAIPVVTDFAALKETVKNGLKIDVNIQSKEGQELYFKELVGYLKNKKEQSLTRKVMIPWARGYFGWDKIAQTWSAKFTGVQPGVQVKKSPILMPSEFITKDLPKIK